LNLWDFAVYAENQVQCSLVIYVEELFVVAAMIMHMVSVAVVRLENNNLFCKIKKKAI
jgi:hypothetical protein